MQGRGKAEIHKIFTLTTCTPNTTLFSPVRNYVGSIFLIRLADWFVSISIGVISQYKSDLNIKLVLSLKFCAQF